MLDALLQTIGTLAVLASIAAKFLYYRRAGKRAGTGRLRIRRAHRVPASSGWRRARASRAA